MEEMVSIIIPTYNREKEIGRAISSILCQTYEQYEIIIVDDGSTDKTQEVVRQMKDDRIRYIRLEHNQGVAHARNVGIQESRYDYIAFLDSDDEWRPEKLELQMNRILEESEDIGLVYCRMSGQQRDGNGRFICPGRKYLQESLEGDMFELLLRQNVIGTPSMLCRKSCLEQVGGFKESLQCLEDWELILRIAKDWRISFVNEILVEVHKSPGSVSINAGNYLVTRCYLVSLYRRVMQETGIFNDVKKEIIEIAGECGLKEEIEELLNRDFDL